MPRLPFPLWVRSLSGQEEGGHVSLVPVLCGLGGQESVCSCICPPDQICGIGKIVTRSHHTCLEMLSGLWSLQLLYSLPSKPNTWGSDVLSICHALHSLVAFFPYLNQHPVSLGHWCFGDGHTPVHFLPVTSIFLEPEAPSHLEFPPISPALAT